MFPPPMDRDDVDAYAIEELGAWLRDWRIATGRTQRQLAAYAGIDQSGISRLERGLTRVASVRLARLVIALDWLSGGGEPPGPWSATYLPPGAVRVRPPGAGPPKVIRLIVHDDDAARGIIREWFSEVGTELADAHATRTVHEDGAVADSAWRVEEDVDDQDIDWAAGGV